MSEKADNPYDMNSSSFDADKYLQKLLKVIFVTYLNEDDSSKFHYSLVI